MSTNLVKITGKVRYILENRKKGTRYVSLWRKNTITSVGKAAVSRRLVNAGELSNEAIITYGALGNGSTVISAGNTTLGNETIRRSFSHTSYGNLKASCRVYFPSVDANGTHTEFGMFGENASATTDSGTMFNHIQIDVTKTSSDTLTMESEITVG